MRYIKKSAVINFNAETINNRVVDDSRTDTGALWTAYKITTKLNNKYTKSEVDGMLENVATEVFHAGTTPPIDNRLFWVDTN